MPYQGITYPTRTKQPGVIPFVGRFEGAGTSAPTNLVGDAVSVTRGAPGIYVITLPGLGSLTYLSLQVTLQDSGGALIGTVRDADNGARTVQVFVHDDAGVATDLAAGDVAHWVVWTKNSTGK